MARSPRDDFAGLPVIRDYGSYDTALNADHTLVDTAVGALHGFPVVRLVHETRGYVPAGSMVRWQEARWSVRYQDPDGAGQGRSFLESDEDAARALFAKWTDPQAVSAKRQEQAMLEETVYRPAREARAKAAAEAADAERKRRRDLAAFRRAQKKAQAA